MESDMNETLCQYTNVNATENGTTLRYSYPDPPPLFQLIPLSIVLISAILIALAGNTFIIYAFIRFPHLRTQFNTYIFNLSIADLFVGVIVMPSFFLYSWYGYWPFGEPMCSVWIFADWFMTFESVQTLAVISVERLWSITWPISYKTWHTSKQVQCVIIVTWVVVACIWIPAFAYDRLFHDNIVEDCAWDPAKNYASGIYVGILGYLVPFFAMTSCYAVVGWKMRLRIRRSTPLQKVYPVPSQAEPTVITIPINIPMRPIHKKSAHSVSGGMDTNNNTKIPLHRKLTRAISSRDGSALVTLGGIGLAFSLCWIPFYVFFFVTLFNWGNLPGWFLTLSYWLAYLNSAVNPVLYTVLNDDMRRKALDALRCIRKKKVTAALLHTHAPVTNINE